MVVPGGKVGLRINHLSFVHGVIADVHDRPWVCLGGSVGVLGSGEKGSKTGARKYNIINMRDEMF